MADARRQSLEKPDVRTGRCQLNMAQALTTNIGQRDFNAALVADNAPMLHALVLAAQALPVCDGTKDAGAEQPIALRFKGAIVDGFRLGYFPMRPATDLLRRSQADSNGIKVGNGIAGAVKWT